MILLFVIHQKSLKISIHSWSDSLTALGTAKQFGYLWRMVDVTIRTKARPHYNTTISYDSHAIAFREGLTCVLSLKLVQTMACRLLGTEPLSKSMTFSTIPWQIWRCYNYRYRTEYEPLYSRPFLFKSKSSCKGKAGCVIVSEHSVCWQFGVWDPDGFKSCIQQRKTTCLLSIRISLACARASKLTTNNIDIAQNMNLCTHVLSCLNQRAAAKGKLAVSLYNVLYTSWLLSHLGHICILATLARVIKSS